MRRGARWKMENQLEAQFFLLPPFNVNEIEQTLAIGSYNEEILNLIA